MFVLFTGCDEILWEYQVTHEDATGKSAPISVWAKLTYGPEAMEEGVPTTIQTRCQSEPYGVEDLEENSILKYLSGTTTFKPGLDFSKCPNPFISVTNVDTVIREGTPCTTDYRTIKRDWTFEFHHASCITDLPPLASQTIILGGAIDQDSGTPATPIFELENRTFTFPYVNPHVFPPVASVSSAPEDFYVGGELPSAECGLCDDTDKAIVYSKSEDFDCNDEGENTISITVLNNIGIRVTKTATARIVGLDTDSDGVSDVCEDDGTFFGAFLLV